MSNVTRKINRAKIKKTKKPLNAIQEAQDEEARVQKVQVQAEKDKATGCVLLKAADLIEKEGWVQGQYEYNGEYCALGAIAKIEQKSNIAHIQNSRAARFLHNAVRHRGFVTVPSWNDTPGRSKDEVVNLMREVATDILLQG